MLLIRGFCARCADGAALDTSAAGVDTGDTTDTLLASECVRLFGGICDCAETWGDSDDICGSEYCVAG